MSPILLLVTLLVGLIGNVASECANACSGHGKCTSYDMCICNRNWQANDCSERVCQFGLAHVDTPKGDLNMDGVISNANSRIVENSFNYPYGTSEQFPNMQNSNNQNVGNSAHDYMECSNKGECDRTTGECKCFDGYDGVACQRASCSNSCSGHGVCKSARQLAAADHGNIYKLWDKLSTMGCECDTGFGGPDCSEKMCKYGVDPLYLDDISTIKYPVWSFATLKTGTTAFHDSQDGTAYWAIRFFDSHGEDWLTNPIVAGATCNQVMKELYSIPNNVIPWDSLRCTRVTRSAATAQNAADWNVENGNGDAGSAHDLGMDDGHGLSTTSVNPDDDNGMDAIPGNGNDRTYYIRPNMAIWEASYATTSNENSEWGSELLGSGSGGTSTNTAAQAVTLTGHVYRIQFLGNPGNLREPEIEVHLDGKRPMLQTGNADLERSGVSALKRVITKVWTDGQQGEDEDYFADHCDGVQVSVSWTDSSNLPGTVTPTAFSRITPRNNAQIALLKHCLGDADFDTTNNVELSDWDTGDQYYPHLIKLVRSVTTYTDGGFYAALWFDGGIFKLVNPFYAPDETAPTVSGSIAGTDLYEVYTTTGTLALTSKFAEAVFGFASKYIFTVRAKADSELTTTNQLHTFDGDLSCETARQELEGSQTYDNSAATTAAWRLGTRGSTGLFGFASRFPGMWSAALGHTPNYAASGYVLGVASAATAYSVEHCLNKSDIFTLLNFDAPISNPARINLYRAQRLFRNDYANAWSGVSAKQGGTQPTFTTALDHHAHWMTRVITTDLSTNWAADNFYDQETQVGVGGFKVYKFFPAAKSTYKYVAPCSNRGVCDTTSGLCQCFPGYTSDSCSEQSSLAI